MKLKEELIISDNFLTFTMLHIKILTLNRLYSDSDLISKHIVKESAVFPTRKKRDRSTAGSEKTCFQQQQN